MQGIETVRRDNCLLVRNVVTTCLERILINKDVGGAQDYVRSAIADLLMNRMDLSLLVITKVCPWRRAAAAVQLGLWAGCACGCGCRSPALSEEGCWQ